MRHGLGPAAHCPTLPAINPLNAALRDARPAAPRGLAREIVNPPTRRQGADTSVPNANVIGSGPNGLAAAITLAQSGWRVTVFEAEPVPGGGLRSAELTLPGFVHDICASVFPLAAASPFFRTLPLARHGLEWIEPPAALAHPFDDGTAETLVRDSGPLAAAWPSIEHAVLGPPAFPRHPFALARFAASALRSASSLARTRFRDARARALFAGLAAHSGSPLEEPLTAGIGLTLETLAHVTGWPIARGGAQSLANALASHLRSLGGEILTATRVRSLDELPPAQATLCDLSPKPLLEIAGPVLPSAYRRKLERYRYGAASFKVDWALDAPIPWTAAACTRAATVHLGGTFDEIAASEREVSRGACPDRPFVILVQPSLFDPTRAPAGKHTAWGYCHVPNGSGADMLARIENQVERFAPGFRARILARHVMRPADLERHNPNFVGGDIAAGELRFCRLPYRTPREGLYVCSAATAPGPGVHGMCGYHCGAGVHACEGSRDPPSLLE